MWARGRVGAWACAWVVHTALMPRHPALQPTELPFVETKGPHKGRKGGASRMGTTAKQGIVLGGTT